MFLLIKVKKLLKRKVKGIFFIIYYYIKKRTTKYNIT
jgi:hypothetical protein